MEASLVPPQGSSAASFPTLATATSALRFELQTSIYCHALCPAAVLETLKDKLANFRSLSVNYAGYPATPFADPIACLNNHATGARNDIPTTDIGNMSFKQVYDELTKYVIVNVGPHRTSGYKGCNVFDMETELCDMLIAITEYDKPIKHFEVVSCASSTIAIRNALRNALASYKNAFIVCSSEGHNAISGACRYLGLPEHRIKRCAGTENGQIDLTDVELILSQSADLKPEDGVIVFLTGCTTAKGAYDDIRGVRALLDRHGFFKSNSYIHVDYALGFFFINMLNDEAAKPFQIDMVGYGIRSANFSTYKVCESVNVGAFSIFDRRYVAVGEGADFVNVAPDDATYAGARDGRVILDTWIWMRTRGYAGILHECMRICALGSTIAATVNTACGEAVIKRHAYSGILFFETLSENITERFVLATGTDKFTGKKVSHIVVRPHAQEGLYERFSCAIISEVLAKKGEIPGVIAAKTSGINYTRIHDRCASEKRVSTSTWLDRLMDALACW
ncbi:unnamed protein product [Sphacelaria rigidula]